MSEKKLFTRRLDKKLLTRMKTAATKSGITHTRFIEQAIDEKLQRDGFYKSSAFGVGSQNN